MSDLRTLEVTRDARGVATVVLDRPERRNAMNPEMIADLAATVGALGEDASVRAVVFRGNGPVFCAGADLGWMRAAEGAREDDIAADSRALQEMYAVLAACPKATIARLHGAVMAGALGLVAGCDIALAASGTRFCLSEVRLGLAPGIVSSFLLPRIGPGWFRYFAVSGRVFGTAEALAAGLIHVAAADEAALDAALEEHCGLALEASPGAIAATKALLSDMGAVPESARFADALAWNLRTRASDAAREGISAFLARRPPAWADGA